MYAQTAKYELQCPVCSVLCDYGLYVHQYGSISECYFCCVSCVSKLRRISGVKEWNRLDAKDLNEWTQQSWQPCTLATKDLLVAAEAKRKDAKSRKRKASKRTLTPPKKKPTNEHSSSSDDDSTEIVESIQLYIRSIEKKLRLVKRALELIR